MRKRGPFISSFIVFYLFIWIILRLTDDITYHVRVVGYKLLTTVARRPLHNCKRITNRKLMQSAPFCTFTLHIDIDKHFLQAIFPIIAWLVLGQKPLHSREIYSATTKSCNSLRRILYSQCMIRLIEVGTSILSVIRGSITFLKISHDRI